MPSYDDSREPEDAPKVFVGNLPYTVRARELGQHFSRCGKIVAVDVIQDPVTGRSKGYGFIEFQEFAAMDKAIDEMNATLLDGNSIRVARANKMTPRVGGDGHGDRDGGGDRGGGYGGGDRGGGNSGRGGHRDDADGGYGRDYPSSRTPRKAEGFRLTIKGLPSDADWRVLKDFMRQAGNVTYTNVQANGVGVGEYATAEECLRAMDLLDGTSLQGSKVFLFPLNFDHRTRQKFDSGGGAGSAADARGGGGDRGGGRDGGGRDAYDRGGGGSYDRGGRGAYDGGGGGRDAYDRGGGGGGYDRGGRDPAPAQRSYDRGLDRNDGGGGSYSRPHDNGRGGDWSGGGGGGGRYEGGGGGGRYEGGGGGGRYEGGGGGGGRYEGGGGGGGGGRYEGGGGGGGGGRYEGGGGGGGGGRYEGGGGGSGGGRYEGGGGGGGGGRDPPRGDSRYDDDGRGSGGPERRRDDSFSRARPYPSR